jgi:hypothetical protein
MEARLTVEAPKAEEPVAEAAVEEEG